MYTLDKSGIKRDEWTIAKKLNENITARIRTNNGQTRRIQIKDSIRQGGVLAARICKHDGRNIKRTYQQ